MEENRVIEIGERIAFIKNTNARNRKCYLLDYGKYLGKYIPTEDDILLVTNKKKKKLMRKNSNEACKFLLDDGTIVWFPWDGWFMLESRFKEVFINDCFNEGWKVVNIDMKGRRRKIK